MSAGPRREAAHAPARSIARCVALAVALAATVYAVPLRAQERIPLDAAATNRLGLMFATLAAPDAGDGAQFPARVSASPLEASELHAVHGGILEAWHVQPGDAVEAGAVVASLRSASALALQQDYVAAEAAQRQASFEHERDRRLFEQGIIAEQRLRETERRAREASFRLQAAELALAQTGFDPAGLTALREQGTALGIYRIRAPFAGTLAHLNHVAGDRVEEGDALATFAGERLWIRADLPASLATRVATGQRLRLVDGGAELVVRTKDGAVDAATQTVGVQAEFVDAVDLLPGQLVTLALPSQADGVLVPADAVVRSGSDMLVYVRRPDGVEARVVELQPLGANYLATHGLAAGDAVVVRGASLLKGITLGLGGE